MRELIKLLFNDDSINEDDAKEAIEQHFKNKLKGKRIKDAKGHGWEVTRVECRYGDISDNNNFFSVNVYLKDYNPESYFLYYDDKFDGNINKEMKGFYTSFSEQGMQGGDYVNLDVEFPSF